MERRDKSGNTVSLLFLPLLEDLTQIDEISWGSGVLACLYRNMCKASKKSVWQIAGPILLLQLWSWERISIGRPIIRKSHVVEEEGVNYPLGSQLRAGVDPLGCKWLRVHRYYKDHRLGLNVLRDLLDKMVELQFVWVPYTTTVLQNLSPRCSENQEEWLVITPLICFEVVEWHLPNRCVRQFGWHQAIPLPCNTRVELHEISRKGDNTTNYAVIHTESIGLWNNRMNKRVQPGNRYSGLMDHDDEYLKWYHAITRRLISPLSSMVYDDYENHHNYYPTAADYQTLTEGIIFNYNTTTTMLNNMPDDVPLGYYAMIEKMHTMSLNALRKTRQGHLIGDEEPRESTPPRYDFRQLEHRQQHNPSQESEGRESSSRPQKKGRSRGER
ncbi:serine/threonine-protein phosphatase 7 long form homolog isoform X2 [Silene latifolia]|uniref:serine/threonine-protein phosphatase 7 long form homolog isoform X2 n=1 Tax=Silene latifolia TaxID=37657 RepID=UPI003D77178A